MTEVFLLSQPFRVYLKHQPDFLTRTIKYIYHGTELLSFFGPNIREVVSTQLETMESLEAFKSGMKKWQPEMCPKTYNH